MSIDQTIYRVLLLRTFLKIFRRYRICETESERNFFVKAAKIEVRIDLIDSRDDSKPGWSRSKRN